MSFSSLVKQEITQRHLQRSCCRLAAAYGVACFGRYFDSRGVVLHTELQPVAEYAKWLYSQLGVTGEIVVKGSQTSPVYEFAVKQPDQVQKMLAAFGVSGEEPTLRINSRNITCSRCTGAFLGAAFLCSGTMSDPNKDYNLEFVTGRHMLARDLEGFLAEHEFRPRRILRKGTSVVYIKASEQIEDMLTFMGAPAAAMEIMGTKVLKDFRNKANRLTNCETANIDKAVAASAATLEAIGALRAAHALEALPEPLREAARLREEYPDLSLKELAARFDPPLSKSGLSHRIKKLEQLAKDLRERNEHV